MAENISKEMLSIAEIIKQNCIQAAIDGYENAAISGLCHEGAVEASVSAIQMIDTSLLLTEYVQQKPD